MKGYWYLLGLVVLLGMVTGCAGRRVESVHLPEGEGALTVEIEGFRNDAGEVIVSLFASDRGFPEEMEAALRNGRAEISERRARVVFERVPYGTYAISVLHDENRNGRMESGLFGRPLEGHGASNDARRTFAPPKFKDARFILDGAALTLRIRVEYARRRGPGE